MLICSSWVAGQSLPANSSKMAAWGGGAADQGETQQSSRKAMSETPTRHVEGPKTSTTRCVPSRRKRGSGPQTAGPARGKGRRAAAGPPGRPRFRRFPGNHPTYSADPSARSALRPPTRLCSAQRPVPRHLKSTDGGRWKPRV